MPLFKDSSGVLSVVTLEDFPTERALQKLIEGNLESTYGCHFVASEFSTGVKHGGRIDTLALSEEGNPVIIEYKNVQNGSLTNQALFYLDWLKDHRGDFELAVKKVLPDAVVNWDAIRVICIAPSYDNYALHAVQQMGAEIELWRFRKFSNGFFELEEVYRPSGAKKKVTLSGASDQEDPEERPTYSVDQHLEKGTAETVALYEKLHLAITEIDPAIDLVPQKFYLAYKLARNLVCVEIQKKKVVVTLNRKAYEGMPPNFHDLTNKGHWGTGDIEAHVHNDEELAVTVKGIRETYLLAGGD